MAAGAIRSGVAAKVGAVGSGVLVAVSSVDGVERISASIYDPAADKLRSRLQLRAGRQTVSQALCSGR